VVEPSKYEASRTRGRVRGRGRCKQWLEPRREAEAIEQAQKGPTTQWKRKKNLKIPSLTNPDPGPVHWSNTRLD